jgi:polyisoprenoid-binding protein YceI
MLPAMTLFALLVPASAPAAKWAVRPKASGIALEFSYLGSPVKAKFGRFTAAIDFDPADLGHSVADVRVDTGSFDSANDDRDEFATEADWFAVARFPEARFLTRSIRLVSTGRYEASADLTIRGATKSVTLPFTISIAGDVARMDGALTLLRTDFGVGQGEWASTKEVGGAVEVTVHVVADRIP